MNSKVVLWPGFPLSLSRGGASSLFSSVLRPEVAKPKSPILMFPSASRNIFAGYEDDEDKFVK